MSPIGEEDLFDPPPYPDDWTAEQRVGAYWHALAFGGLPHTTEGWFVVEKSLERERERRAQRRTREGWA